MAPNRDYRAPSPNHLLSKPFSVQLTNNPGDGYEPLSRSLILTTFTYLQDNTKQRCQAILISF
ncbi:MAG: hypothetical protein ACI89T_000426 [Cognaticolwellia sp.]|jgi:hypothetical protein